MPQQIGWSQTSKLLYNIKRAIKGENAYVPQEIGWSTEDNLLQGILKEESCICEPPPYVYPYTLSNGGSAGVACSGLPGDTLYYLATEGISVGKVLYADAALTTPVPDGWYGFLGTQTAYHVVGGSGLITGDASCTTTTTSTTTTTTTSTTTTAAP